MDAEPVLPARLSIDVGVVVCPLAQPAPCSGDEGIVTPRIASHQHMAEAHPLWGCSAFTFVLGDALLLFWRGRLPLGRFPCPAPCCRAVGGRIGLGRTEASRPQLHSWALLLEQSSGAASSIQS